MTPSAVEFPPYRLEFDSGLLFRDGHAVILRPKTWAMLRYLAARSGVIVPKEELIAAVWGNATVSDDALTRTVGELRQALRDDARRPRYIQTVHRRGFRFVAKIKKPGASTTASPSRDARSGDDIFVGRHRELAALDAAFRTAAAGRRQVVFVTGEPGSGKSALVHTFLERLRHSGQPVRIGWGRSKERVGARESFAPVRESLERLAEYDDDLVRAALATFRGSQAEEHAADAGATERHESGPRVTVGRSMGQAFADFVNTVSTDVPLVLAFEDLHWSDLGTVDVISDLAQQTEPRCRLLIVATCRQAEASVRNHPICDVISTLKVRGHCDLIELNGLSLGEVADYVQQRLRGAAVDERVAPLVHRSSDGNPLFAGVLVDHLRECGSLVEAEGRWVLAAESESSQAEIPDGLRQVLEQQLRLITPAERALLDAGSVAGTVFDTAAVAAAVGASLPGVESLCERMSRTRSFVTAEGRHVWPDGTAGIRYRFVHSAYQRVLHDRLRPGRRALIHQRIAERLERAYRGRTREIAADLADHYLHANDRQRAARYLGQSAERAFEQGAFRDAAHCLEAALQQIDDVQDTREIARQELELRQLYTVALSLIHGNAAGAVWHNLTRVLDLAKHLHDVPAQFDATYAMGIVHINRAACAAAAELASNLLSQAEVPGIAAPWRAHFLAGAAALWQGDLANAEQWLAHARLAPMIARAGSPWFGVDPSIGATSQDSLRLALVGESRHACAQQAAAVARAERQGHSFTMAHAVTFEALIYALGEHWSHSAQAASRAFDVARHHGFPRWMGTALICRGRALVARHEPERGLLDIRNGHRLLRDTGVRLGASLLWSLTAGAFLQTRNWSEGLHAVEEGLAHCHDTTERLFESSLWRLKGELLTVRGRDDRRSGGPGASFDDADRCIARALTIARDRGAIALARSALAAQIRISSARAGADAPPQRTPLRPKSI
jgi:DNA-binding winged helix-turn-helix (wHTH) protein